MTPLLKLAVPVGNCGKRDRSCATVVVGPEGVPLVILAFWIGIYPKPFFAIIDKPVQKIVEQVNPDFYKTERAKLPAPEIHADVIEAK